MKIRSIQISGFRSFPEVEETTLPIRLEDLSILVGKNNSGKSNVFRAIRYFYREDDYKSGVAEEDFFIDEMRRATELWVEIEFTDLDSEELESIPEKYVLPDKTFRIRRSAFLKDTSSGRTAGLLNAYECVDDDIRLSETKYKGFDEVGLASLGDILHVPTVKDLPDELKGSTQSGSLFAKMMKEIIQPAVEQLQAFDELQAKLQELELELRGSGQETEVSGVPNTLTEIETELSEALVDWQTRVSIKFSSIPASDIVQRVAGMKVAEGPKSEISPENMGHGPQRYLLFAMIRLWARVEKYRAMTKKKVQMREAKLAVLLYEEPELYLDPYQQQKLADYLLSLSQKAGVQVIISTHSPYIIPSEHEDFRRVVRLQRTGGITVSRQASEEFISAATAREYQEEFRFALWLNADRKSAYFAEWVVLAEGNEEKVALNYLAEQLETPKPRPVVLDCGGKKQIPKFMELAREMGICHKVLADDDTHISPNEQRRTDSDTWGKQIVSAKNEFTLGEPVFVKETLPKYLTGVLSLGGDCRPLELLKWLEQNPLDEERRKFMEDILAPPPP